MWQLYAETLFELYDDENVRPKVMKQLNDVCCRAVSTQKLLENHIVDWVILSAS